MLFDDLRQQRDGREEQARQEQEQKRARDGKLTEGWTDFALKDGNLH